MIVYQGYFTANLSLIFPFHHLILPVLTSVQVINVSDGQANEGFGKEAKCTHWPSSTV